MPQATLGRVRLRGLVPRSLGVRPAVALERAFGESFAAVVDEAFDPLAEVDQGAMWVLRRLDVYMTVPASEPDALAQSRRIAAGLARAVRTAVAAGPSTEAVRFASRADHVAAYIRARISGGAASWVFDRFASVAALPPADAMVAAARIAEVDLVDVVRELAERGGWERLLIASGRAESGRLAAAIARRVGSVPASAASLAAVAIALRRRAEVSALGGRSARAAWPARDRLALVGDLAAAHAVDAEMLAAIWRLAPSASAAADRKTARLPSEVAPEAVAAEEPGAPPLPADAADVGTLPGGPRLISAAGVPAFLLLPDLAALLADDPVLSADAPVAAAARAIVLAGVLGDRVDEDDDGVVLAAGVVRAPEPQEWQAYLSGPLTAAAERLASDPVLGWRHPGDEEWCAAAVERSPALGTVSIALLRAFARHLAGFAQARASHVVPQVLPAGGVVRLEESVIEATLPVGPLHVLLALGGLDAVAFRVPWLPARLVVGHEVAS